MPSPSISIIDLLEALDQELKIDSFEDISHNGLQVSRRAEKINKVCCGVDASLEFFTAAHERGADFLICHHGISWGDSLKRITDLNYTHIAYLVDKKMALWACHLPLDAHASLGNNAQIAQALNLKNVFPFGTYRGQTIGFGGELSTSLTSEELHRILEKEFENTVHALPFGRKQIHSIGIISGGAADEVVQAEAEGLDAYISGEPTLVSYNLAKQLGINVFFGGHYATERYGVRALARWIHEKFGIETEFIDFQIPF